MGAFKVICQGRGQAVFDQVGKVDPQPGDGGGVLCAQGKYFFELVEDEDRGE